MKKLNEIERRVVGTLLEKVLSTPTAYPLTLNALVAGCNQKNNREPEMTLSEETVERTLHALQEGGLAVSVVKEGARAEKWRTTAREVYGLASERLMALFAELLLRGPATKNELRTRASRMRHEISAEELDQMLQDLMGREEPLAINIGRAPGGRAERFTHTLWDEQELAAIKAGSTHAAPPAAPRAEAPAAAAVHDPGTSEKLAHALERIAALEERVAALEKALAEPPQDSVRPE